MPESQLYLHAALRESKKQEIRLILEIYNERLFPQFNQIEQEAEQYQEEVYDAYSQSTDPSMDPVEAAERSFEAALGKYEDLSLIKYSFTASAISTLFMIFEQQLRRFLFKEMRHTYEIDMASFCTRFEQIHECFQHHGVDLKKLPMWTKVNELQLLSNVIKHGDGQSARVLRQIKPSLFMKEYVRKDFPLLIESTLLLDVLVTDQQTFTSYGEALVAFWDALPERSHAQ